MFAPTGQIEGEGGVFMRSSRLCAALVAVVCVLVVAPSGASAASWTGLGDSFAAGPLIPDQSFSPLGCLRSSNNFARQSATRLGYTLTDMSCSGAKTDHMTQSQSTDAGTNPPQFNGLTAGTNVVTLQIGGNDIGFSGILQDCVTWNPFSSPCRSKYNPNSSTDVIATRISQTAPKVAAAIQGIRARSPQARIFVVNYAAILPDSGSGCWPQVPLAFSDVPYLRAKHKQLNAMLATQAAANGAAIVDDYTASIGRDACRGSSTRWVEPLVPENSAAPFHPNRNGMNGITNVVVARVGS
jgi:lysophospholipase L1-like esterase